MIRHYRMKYFSAITLVFCMHLQNGNPSSDKLIKQRYPAKTVSVSCRSVGAIFTHPSNDTRTHFSAFIPIKICMVNSPIKQVFVTLLLCLISSTGFHIHMQKPSEIFRQSIFEVPQHDSQIPEIVVLKEWGQLLEQYNQEPKKSRRQMIQIHSTRIQLRLLEIAISVLDGIFMDNYYHTFIWHHICHLSHAQSCCYVFISVLCDNRNDNVRVCKVENVSACNCHCFLTNRFSVSLMGHYAKICSVLVSFILSK